MFKISEFANVGFSGYPYFIPNSYSECTQLAVEKCNRESAFYCEISSRDRSIAPLNRNYAISLQI